MGTGIVIVWVTQNPTDINKKGAIVNKTISPVRLFKSITGKIL